MSTDTTPSFDDFGEAETDESSGSDWIDLEAGDEHGGQVTAVNLQAGHNGVIEIDGQPTYLDQKMPRQMIPSLVEGFLTEPLAKALDGPAPSVKIYYRTKLLYYLRAKPAHERFQGP